MNKEIVTKLMIARNEVDEALRLSTPNARYDRAPVLPTVRNKLAGLRDNLDKIISEIEGE